MGEKVLRFAAGSAQKIPKALVELDARLAKVLAQAAPEEAHTVSAGVQADKTAAAVPAKQRVRDTPGKAMEVGEKEAPAVAATSKPATKPNTRSKAASRPPPKEKPDPIKPPDEGANTKKQKALDAEAIIIREKSEKIAEKIGTDIKNHPLRIAYEAEVAGLKREAEIMSKSGATNEDIARKMWERRREIGVKYKNVTPEPLRDYIYALNKARYGDPLGPSFDFLLEASQQKMGDPYIAIIESCSRPNGDINTLLSKFKDWLVTKNSDYLDDASKKLKD